MSHRDALLDEFASSCGLLLAHYSAEATSFCFKKIRKHHKLAMELDIALTWRVSRDFSALFLLLCRDFVRLDFPRKSAEEIYSLLKMHTMNETVSLLHEYSVLSSGYSQYHEEDFLDTLSFYEALPFPLEDGDEIADYKTVERAFFENTRFIEHPKLMVSLKEAVELCVINRVLEVSRLGAKLKEIHGSLN